MSANKRRAYRVDDTIPMRDTPLSNEMFEDKRLRIIPRSSQSSMIARMVGEELPARSGFDHLDSDISKALQIMDQKLNYLISAQILNDASQLSLSEQPVNISVSGMRFVTENQYRDGDGLEITMMLPSFPPLLMELLAKVRRAKPAKAGQQEIAVDFVFRNGDEERSISRHIFKRQREMIRRTDQKA